MSYPKQNTIAIVYDFDGTLTSDSMQDYTVLPELNIKSRGNFWKDIYKESDELGFERDLLWMMKILNIANEKRYSLNKSVFKALGQKIKYFKGVPRYFKHINQYVNRCSSPKMKIRHYIISSGLKEILLGITLRKNFKRIYGSEYHYDHNRIPVFPKVVITDTAKTQYLFRINKGKENISESINSYMKEIRRPIPFKNIIPDTPFKKEELS